LKLLASKHPSLAIFGLLFGATTWGIIWYPYRLLNEAGLSGVPASLATEVVSVLIGLFLFRRDWKSIVAHPGTLIPLILVAGWANLSYVLAVIGGEVMRVLLLFYLSPLWTLLLAKVLLDERPGRRGLFVITLSLTGAFTMLWHPDAGVPYPQNEYEWMALSSGFCFALGNVMTRRATHLTLEAKAFAIWAGVVIMALMLLPFISTGMPDWNRLTPVHWGIVVMVGMILVVATLLVQYGITHTPVTRASVIFLFELVVAAISSYFLAGEELKLREWIGGAMIVAATIFVPKDTD
jgi:drug/metabolite transporter (DMT)-like permease